MPDAMRALRLFKSDIALLTALCDLGGVWPVMTVTRRLSEAADAAVAAAVRLPLRARRAPRAIGWRPILRATSCSPWASTAPSSSTTPPTSISSSSTTSARVRLRAGLEVQPFFVRLTRDLVRLLHERTEHGYVFRTDLRLRPDPGSTPLAISTDAALNYYESFGQNWERAALIKARAVAGDIRRRRRASSPISPPSSGASISISPPSPTSTP